MYILVRWQEQGSLVEEAGKCSEIGRDKALPLSESAAVTGLLIMIFYTG
jgi:hypothetical protein